MMKSWQRPIPLLGFGIALLAAGQISLAHQRNELSQEASVIRRQHQAIQAELNQLHLELASLTRPQRLRTLAASELGMGPPAARQVVRP